LIFLFLLLNLIKSSFCYSFDGSVSPNDVSSLVENILSNCSSTPSSNCFGTQWGIVIDSYDSSTGEFTNLYSLNELQSFTPASNTKLLTTITIFYTFGEDFKVATPFFTDKPFEPNQDFEYLCVKGMGDPSMTMDQIQDVATFFSKSGSIKNLILDNSFYINANNDPIPPAWEWEDLTSNYGAIPTPLMVNENTMNIFINPSTQVGSKPVVSFQYPGESKYLQVINNIVTGASNSVTSINYQFKIASSSIVLSGNIAANSQAKTVTVPILDPEQYFITVFTEMLAENGLNVGSASIGSCNDTSYDYKPITLYSPPLSSMLNYTLLTSDNLYAETFLRLLGTFNQNTSLPANTPTDARGLQYIQSILGQSLLYTQVDGSGLSRNNFITPKALISAVEGVYTNVGDPQHDYISYLPVSGVSGTLSRRFINTPAQGIVHAKTGSMTGVHSLTGVVLPKGIHNNNQNPIFFSIIGNSSPSQDRNINGIIDEIVILLSQI
ncbi:hypothetical protein DICPUDRAFT_6688, partial [Dictyostelium purpureum]